MLSFLSANRKEAHAVIIDDISRLARGLMAHFELRVKIGDAGGVLVSPSIEFGEDSDSQLVENLLASVSQHQQQRTRTQTLEVILGARTKARCGCRDARVGRPNSWTRRSHGRQTLSGVGIVL